MTASKQIEKDEAARAMTSAQMEAAREMRRALEDHQDWWNDAFPRSLMRHGITGTVIGPRTQSMLDKIEAAIAAAEAAGIKEE
jgi:hypothetical protein